MAPLQEILALKREGKWNEAHNLVQYDDSSTAAWLHALLHVQKGDLEDAEYWYQDWAPFPQPGHVQRGGGSAGGQFPGIGKVGRTAMFVRR